MDLQDDRETEKGGEYQNSRENPTTPTVPVGIAVIVVAAIKRDQSNQNRGVVYGELYQPP